MEKLGHSPIADAIFAAERAEKLSRRLQPQTPKETQPKETQTSEATEYAKRLAVLREVRRKAYTRRTGQNPRF